MKRRPVRTVTAYALMTPAMILLGVFFVLPFWGIVLDSFTYSKDGVTRISLENYQHFWSTRALYSPYLNALTNCLHIAILVIPLQIMVSIFLTSLITARQLNLSRMYLALAIFPNFIGIVILGATVNYLFANSNGALVTLFAYFGLEEWFVPYFYSPSHAIAAISFLVTGTLLSHALFPIYNAARNVPPQALDAANLAGMNVFWRFVRIKMTYIWPTVLVVALFILTTSISAFDMVYVIYAVHGGYDLNLSTDLLSTLFYRQLNNFDNVPHARDAVYVMITTTSAGMIAALSVVPAIIGPRLRKGVMLWK